MMLIGIFSPRVARAYRHLQSTYLLTNVSFIAMSLLHYAPAIAWKRGRENQNGKEKPYIASAQSKYYHVGGIFYSISFGVLSSLRRRFFLFNDLRRNVANVWLWNSQCQNV